MSGPMLSRRHLLASGSALFAWAYMPKPSSAGPGRDPRLLVVVLRGALDGLSAVPPVGDPAYAAARGELALGTAGSDAALPLDGTFALNPKLAGLHRLYGRGEALVVAATASPYRERSHFDGQAVLESGYERVGGRDGWLNRALSALPAGDRVARSRGLAIGPSTPLIMRGSAQVLSWTPQLSASADDDVVRRVLALYDARDPELAAALRFGAKLDAEGGTEGGGGGGADAAQSFPSSIEAAARLLTKEDGPRVAAMNVDGWDTHANQGATSGRLGRLLTWLNAGIDRLETELRPVWDQTAVLFITEFGRTVHVNGTSGTDHGTATVAFLVGGAVRGGRVLADWPGLAPAQLYEGRDLRPTIDLRAVLKGVLHEHLGVSQGALDTQVFPGTVGLKPLDGLMRSA